MLFSLAIGLLTLVSADPPSSYQDQEIKQRCAREEITSYDDCLRRLGQEAYQKQKQEEPAEASEAVCRPREAINYCKNAHQEAAKINSSEATDAQISAAIQDCKMKCNPGSSLMLREFLGGCGTQGSDEKKMMASLSDKCGVAVGEVATDPDKASGGEAGKSWSEWVSSSYDSAKANAISGMNWASDGTKKVLLRNGLYAETFQNTSMTSTQGVELSDGSQYLKTSTRDGDTFYQTVPTTADIRLEANKSTVNAESQSNWRSNFGSNGDTSNLSAHSQPQATSTVGDTPPPPRPANLDTKGAGTGATSSVTNKPASNFSSTAMATADTTSPPPAPQPLVQQAAAPGAFLQNSLNSPISHSGSFSGGTNMAMNDNSELTRAGGMNNGGSEVTTSLPLRTSGSGISGPMITTSSSPSRPGVAPVVASNPAVAPGAGGALNAAFMGSSKSRLSSSPNGGAPAGGTSVASVPSSWGEGFYGGSGSSYSGGYYSVPADPRCKPSRTKRCAMKRVAVNRDMLASNCDGKPECILKLTGKLRWSKNSFKRNGQRGVASTTNGYDVSAPPQATLPQGVWRGYGDVISHINTLGASYLQLDHEGFLVTDGL